jgi:hypothetical protein
MFLKKCPNSIKKMGTKNFPQTKNSIKFPPKQFLYKKWQFFLKETNSLNTHYTFWGHQDAKISHTKKKKKPTNLPTYYSYRVKN